MDFLDVNTCFGALPDRSFDISASMLDELLEKEGIAQAVTASLAGAYLGAEEGNIETLEACEDHPRLLPAATVDPRSYFGKGDVVLKAREQGFVMLRLFNRAQKWPLHFSPVEVIFEEAGEAGLPVMLDAVVFGAVTRACQLSAVTETPVVMTGVDMERLSEVIVCMTEYPRLHIDTSLLATADGLKILCEEGRPEGILFGTGAASACVGSARLTLLTAPISDEDRRNIASLNTLRLLGTP